jgi:hypothetical protein
MTSPRRSSASVLKRAAWSEKSTTAAGLLLYRGRLVAARFLKQLGTLLVVLGLGQVNGRVLGGFGLEFGLLHLRVALRTFGRRSCRWQNRDPEEHHHPTAASGGCHRH